MKSLARRLYRIKEKSLIRYRYVLLWLQFGHVGRRIKCFGYPIFDYPERISIGDGCTVNHGVVLGGRGGLTIGRSVRISSYAVIETGFLKTSGHPRVHGSKPIVIEDNVWIATGAVVLAGVRIGRDSIVAAGALVTRDVPPGSLAKGSPARFSPLKGSAGD